MSVPHGLQQSRCEGCADQIAQNLRQGLQQCCICGSSLVLPLQRQLAAQAVEFTGRRRVAHIGQPGIFRHSKKHAALEQSRDTRRADDRRQGNPDVVPGRDGCIGELFSIRLYLRAGQMRLFH